jgi:hypothetical protein
MSSKRKKSPVRGSIDSPASTVAVSGQGANQQDAPDEKIAIEGETFLLQETKTYTADVNSNGNPSDSRLSPNEEGQRQAIEEQVNDQVQIQVQNQGTEQIDVNENQNMTEQAEISACFDVALAKLKKVRTFVIKQKSQIIMELALDLKATGKIRSDSICIEIIERLRDNVSERLIRKCLDIEYKDKRQAKNAKKQQHKVAAKSAAKHEVIIDTSGHSTQQPNKSDSSDEASTNEAYKRSGEKPQPEEGKWVIEQTGTDRKSPLEQLNESRFENSGRADVNTSGQEMVDPTRTPKENPCKTQEIDGSGDDTDTSPPESEHQNKSKRNSTSESENHTDQQRFPSSSPQHVEWRECSFPFDDVRNKVISQAQSKDQDKFCFCVKLDRPAMILDIRLGPLGGGDISHD